MQTIILLTAAAILLTALFLLLQQPRRKRAISAGAISIDLTCDSGPVLSELAKVRHSLERIVELQTKAGLIGTVAMTDKPKPPPSRMVNESKSPPKPRTSAKTKRR